MPRFSNTKDTPIEFRKRRLQAGTRYRESGLVLRHLADFGSLSSQFKSSNCLRGRYQPKADIVDVVVGWPLFAEAPVDNLWVCANR
jgi:hypothetical protein